MGIFIPFCHFSLVIKFHVSNTDFFTTMYGRFGVTVKKNCFESLQVTRSLVLCLNKMLKWLIISKINLNISFIKHYEIKIPLQI